ncbi:MAG TPA: hypothetical protein VF081_08810 [Solirubrobacterales bacterium]
MNGRRAIVGLCMLCALLVSAFAAQSASAITGTTAFTCVKGGGGKDLRGEHCLATGSAAQEFGHVAVAENTTTDLSATNLKSANETITRSTWRLTVTIAGVPMELTATDVSGSGWLENKQSSSIEHYAHGKGTLTFTEVIVAKPENKGCKVTTHKEDGSGSPGEEGEAGVVHTRELTATTEGQGDVVKIQAADGGNFANFWITCEKGKEVPAIEGTWSCNGSVKGVPSGATTAFTGTETTTQNTLKCKNTKTGFEGSSTMSGREKGSAEALTPLAQTTINTTSPGPTAFTCVKGGGKELRGEHCLTTGTAPAEYGHVQVEQDKTTELFGTNGKTEAETTKAAPAKLRMQPFGVSVEFSAAAISVAGWLANRRGVNGAHYAHGNLALTFTEVVVAKPEGRGCKVTTHKEDGSGGEKEEGEVGIIHTRELKGTTEGQEDLLKVESADGGDIARFFFTCEPGKKIELIEGTWTCNGSVRGVPAGATTTFTHTETTTQNTLKCKNAKAGFESNLTLSGRSPGEELYKPLAATTVTT